MTQISSQRRKPPAVLLLVKDTMIGGIMFLVPLGLLLVVLSEVVDLVLPIAEPIADLFPQEDILGVAANQLIAWILIVLFCFCAGLLVRHTVLSKVSERIEAFLEQLIPGYSMIMTRVSGHIGAETDKARLEPVLVTGEFGKRYGFEIERSKDGSDAVVFFPDAPSASTGSVWRVPVRSISHAETSSPALLAGLKFFGRGLAKQESVSEKEPR